MQNIHHICDKFVSLLSNTTVAAVDDAVLTTAVTTMQHKHNLTQICLFML